jgi:hypothetical protein
VLALYVVGHFFLFCNVFRVRRRPELVWAGIFIIVYSTSAVFAPNAWFVPLAIQAALTVAIIANEVRLPCYHGVVADRINPRLHDYLTGNV